jgi:alanine racemase
LERLGIDIPQKHMANSAAILDLPESYYDLVRPGILIYGLYPSNTVNRNTELRPAMALETRISFLKTVPPGTAISYGQTFVTQRKTKVATLPVGYGDGYTRLLSGRGEVLINGQRAPLIGRICMDMCMVDVSRVPHVKTGDRVTLFGEDLSIDEIAATIGTINYEILCAVGKRVPRIYVR